MEAQQWLLDQRAVDQARRINQMDPGAGLQRASGARPRVSASFAGAEAPL